MKEKIIFTSCGIFLKEMMVFETEYSKQGINLDGSLRAIETIQQAVNWKPIIIWNIKKYNESLRKEVQV